MFRSEASSLGSWSTVLGSWCPDRSFVRRGGRSQALLDLRIRLDSEGAAQVVWSLWRMGASLAEPKRCLLFGTVGRVDSKGRGPTELLEETWKRSPSL